MSIQKTEYYRKDDKIHVATDCIIFGFDDGILKLLLFERRVAPLIGKWSLIGSFVKPNESVRVSAKRVLHEITGLENVYMDELKSYSAIDRDPGARCISIAQYALIRIDDYDKRLVEVHGAKWFAVDEIPELVLDHGQMVKDALKKLRERARYKPIGFELLPEKFTIPQLQELYEALFQEKFDPGNFRKKIISLNVLKKLNEKDKTSSKRGAFRYYFHKAKYKKLLAEGYNFQL